MNINYFISSMNNQDYIELYKTAIIKNQISFLLSYSINNNLINGNHYLKLWEKYLVINKIFENLVDNFTEKYLLTYIQENNYSKWEINFKEGVIDFK